MKKIKQKKCKECGKYFTPFNSLTKVCSTPCAISFAKKETRRKAEKKAKAERLAERKRMRELKEKVKGSDLRHQHKLTQKAFNKMRVLEELKWFEERGLEPTCISCGNPLGNDQWCCGHYKTRGAHPNLKYDRNNTFLQHNHRCNMMLSGDIAGTRTTHGYTEGLKIRFGEEKGQEIIDYCNSYQESKKYTCEELKEMRKEFRAKIKEFSK
ncbi:recombination protein NinG [Phocoenobacter skyensis]|uniref:Bacteriophage Lambda NinG protein n=1 Tax=Phocoenobacter skyensis TaxID=97481 RepID=A0A1H7XM16_9PAST|nr:recombination protein NinG [Pasteurella skyensis]MDP8184384.1 recombination protein NinG [Pasteurella skyensis]QLB22613.1 hypothetical protein A6B44_05090 [Pasteurella skyensis]SEM34039.1 Bacteriophage Lambda NinG protein [Pasteurella skyensis]